MSEESEAYRQKAFEMRQRALAAYELGTRLSYFELAEQWEELARAVEWPKAANEPSMGD